MQTARWFSTPRQANTAWQRTELASMDHVRAAVAETAPAKINLALHITGKRNDGYHLIESLSVFTRFGDRVSVCASGQDEVGATGPFAHLLPATGDNLVARARDTLRRAIAAGGEKSEGESSSPVS